MNDSETQQDDERQDDEQSVRVHSLHVHPVKSCAGIALGESLVIETGLEFDRAWMVVDVQGDGVTQRQLPRMALVRPQMKSLEMVLRAPGMLALHIALDTVEKPVRVTVWLRTAQSLRGLNTEIRGLSGGCWRV